ncbi:hypothetical protein ACQ4PT_071883 [Festuca glaucescens]
MASTSRTSTAVATKAQLAHVAFSSGASHFVACTATGLRVFSCKDLVELVHCRCNASGDKVTCSELLTQSNLAAVIRSPNATDGAADVYGVHFMEWQRGQRQRQTTEATMTLGTPGLGAVGGVRLLGDHMLVAGEKKAVLVVNGNGDPQDKEEKPTGPNPLGLCALAIDQATLVYALPREEKGAVQVCRSGSPDSVDVHAHDSSVACIALSCDGRLLATAGSKGTLVRIFSTDDGSKLQELRRGTDRADINCIVFSPDSKWLAVSSDKATVHVFRVADSDLTSSTPESGVEQKQNAPEEGGQAAPAAAAPRAESPPGPAKASTGSSLSFLKGYLPSYFSSEWSLAQFRLPEGVKYSVAFEREKPYTTILIIGTNGSFYRCQFDPVNAGDMVQLEHRKFMKVK